MEGSGHGLIWGTMLANIQTGCIKNTSQKQWHLRKLALSKVFPYIYIYIYIYTHTHTHIHTCKCVCVLLGICTLNKKYCVMKTKDFKMTLLKQLCSALHATSINHEQKEFYFYVCGIF